MGEGPTQDFWALIPFMSYMAKGKGKTGWCGMVFLRQNVFFSLAITVICKTTEMMPSSPRSILHDFLFIYQKVSLSPLYTYLEPQM